MTTTDRLRRRALLPGLFLLLVTLFVAAACSGRGGDTAGVGTTSAESGGDSASLRDGAEPAAPEAAQPFDSSAASAPRGGQVQDNPVTPLQTRAVISTGTVTLRSKDVEQARFDVQKVIAAHRGEISDEQTGTDDEGRINRSQLVIRVPSQFFDEVMTDLGEVADLRSAKRTSEDVTTEVIDIGVRVRAQEQSLQRIELLLGRAQSLRDIIAIESELSRRQAELDSLKAQQAYLADQTSLSTITVFLEQSEKAAAPVEQDEAGFVAGLQRGWDALGGAATVLATGLGAVLPFLVVLLLLGVPLWLLVRSLLRRRQSEPVPAD
jgi:hypothetical protein